MMRRFRIGIALASLTTVTACAAIFGISDPEIEHVDASNDGGDAANDVDGGGDGGSDGATADVALVCPSGFGDCNGRADDGCEQSLTADGENCGACGHSCRGD